MVGLSRRNISIRWSLVVFIRGLLTQGSTYVFVCERESYSLVLLILVIEEEVVCFAVFISPYWG